MSNYNWKALKGLEELVSVGAEVVNGTGQVQVRVRQEPGEEAEKVFLGMTAGQALDFASLLADQAHEAMREQWKERHLYGG